MTMADIVTSATAAAIALDNTYTAHNYSPLPVVATSARGAWITDVEGRRYLDCLAAYSAVNFGHHNDEIIAAAHRQLDALTLVSRAFHSDQLGPFCAALAGLCGKDMVLPMNSGAEAVESGLKIARKWGTDVRASPTEHGQHHRGRQQLPRPHDQHRQLLLRRHRPRRVRSVHTRIPVGALRDADAVAAAIDQNTVAVLVEPIQGEAGIIVPPDDYLPRLRQLCSQRDVLLIADEIQSGLARTGHTFACDHWGVVPDVYLLGKALGGGIVPLSAVVADRDILGVLHPGEHGSTFGGNPLAAAIGSTVVEILRRGEFQSRSAELGLHLHARLRVADRSGRAGGARYRTVGRRRHRRTPRDRQTAEHGTGRAWRTGQGHPLLDVAVRSAAGDHRRGDRLGG